MLFINQDAVHGAYLLTLRLIVVAYALRTQIRVDFVNFLALRDGVIGALRLANVTVNALICNKERHFFSFFI